MRFERRYEGIHYAITLRPSKTDGKLKTLRELEIEIYRKSPEGHIHGYRYTWKISFFDRELKVERREYSDFSWRKMEVSIKADDLEEWWIDEVEETIRDLGVKDAAEHFLKHLRLIFDHPLSIPLRL